MSYTGSVWRLVIACSLAVGAAPAAACPSGMRPDTLDGPVECAPCMPGHSCPCGARKIATCVSGDGKDGAFERRLEPGGKLLAKGVLEHGTREGAWIDGEWNTGTERHQTFVHGVLDGPYEELSDGHITTIGNFRAGKRDGYWEGRAVGGTKAWSGFYDRGKETGEWASFAPDGTLSSRTTYRGADITFEGYYSGGTQLRSRGHAHLGKHAGLHEQFYADGRLQERAMYADDRLDGPFESYAADGAPITKGQYRAGSEVGTWQLYAPDGKLELVRRFLPQAQKAEDRAEITVTPSTRIVRVHYNRDVYEEEYPFVTCAAGTKRHAADTVTGAIEEWCETATGERTGPYQRWTGDRTDRFHKWRLNERGMLDHGKRVGRWFETGGIVDHK